MNDDLGPTGAVVLSLLLVQLSERAQDQPERAGTHRLPNVDMNYIKRNIIILIFSLVFICINSQYNCCLSNIKQTKTLKKK